MIAKGSGSLGIGRLTDLWGGEDLVVHIVHHIIVTSTLIAVLIGKHADTAHTATDSTAIGLHLWPEVWRVEHHAVHARFARALGNDGRRVGGWMFG